MDRISSLVENSHYVLTLLVQSFALSNNLGIPKQFILLFVLLVRAKIVFLNYHEVNKSTIYMKNTLINGNVLVDTCPL